MATNIFNYNGTLLTTVQDGTIDTTHASIAFPGRGYLNYGEPVNQDLLWIMQNFAAASAPVTPLAGQAWYDTSTQLLKVYNGTAWFVVGGVIAASTPPASGTNPGAFWYDTANNQLNVWSGTAWLLVGPLGSSANTDPVNPSVPSNSAVVAAIISDGVSNHQVWEIIIGGTLFAIVSKDVQFTPSPAVSGGGFATLYPGINFNTNVSNVTVNGATTIFTSVKTNLPSVDNTWNMGSVSQRFANMYAVNFNGVASSALYADVAEYYQADDSYPAGTVLSMSGTEEVTIAADEGSSDVFGVVSTDPAYTMNNGLAETTNAVPVALLGRVPCKVVGQVKKGQRLMASSVEGAACAWDSTKYSTLSIIGRSLEDKTSVLPATIEIFVGKN